MKKSKILLFISSIAFVLIFFSAKTQTSIQMEKKGGVFSVPCKVNGLDLKFIFDTGASDVSISLTEALFMLKNGLLKSEDFIGKEYYSDATGSISEGTKIILRKIEFSGLSLSNVEASVVHQLSAPLLLGQSVMSKLGKFQFDPNSGVLTILNTTKGSGDLGNGFIKDPYLRNFSGKISVYTSSPILLEPDMVNSKSVGVAVDNTVQIISKYNEKYYLVKTGNIQGYIFSGWFKD